VVNQAFVQQFSPEKDPIGRIYSMGKKGRFAEMRIVGVIGDVKQSKVMDPTKPEIYFCLAQMEPGTPLYGIATAFMQVAIRGAVPADALRTQFEKVLHEVAPDATTTEVKSIHQAVEDSFGSQTLIAHLLESFAALALMIASVGLYGLLSFAVSQRTHEIGVRMALGASRAQVLAMVMRESMWVLVAGLAVGIPLTFFAVRPLKSMLYQMSPLDPWSIALAIAAMVMVSGCAALIPARRAASIEPMQALRSE
jgi:ABC-type antimicrobial peptide transport system permease subunit